MCVVCDDPNCLTFTPAFKREASLETRILQTVKDFYVAATADAVGEAFDQVWQELDALRQEREAARTQLWLAVSALDERIAALETGD